MEKANLNVDKQMVLQNSLTRDDGTNAIKKLLQNAQKPDAVFCANDTTALSVIMYLTESGVKVPEEIMVVGFSNEPFSEVVTPSISTIRQPGFEMGKKAAELIIEQIKRKNEPVKFQQIVMPTELIIRQSSKRKS